MAAQSDSAHHIHFEKAAPIVVIDLFKRLGLEDAKIIYEDVYRGKARNHSTRSGFGAQVRSDSVGRAAASNRSVNSLLSAAIYDDRRSFPRQRRGDSQTNAGGRSSHKSRFPVELKIHNSVEMRHR
jgi:hypothetical protein